MWAKVIQIQPELFRGSSGTAAAGAARATDGTARRELLPSPPLMKSPQGLSPSPADLGAPFKRLLQGEVWVCSSEQLWGFSLIPVG